jgi:hypothetical protein
MNQFAPTSASPKATCNDMNVLDEIVNEASTSYVMGCSNTHFERF